MDKIPDYLHMINTTTVSFERESNEITRNKMKCSLNNVFKKSLVNKIIKYKFHFGPSNLVFTASNSFDYGEREKSKNHQVKKMVLIKNNMRIE